MLWMVSALEGILPWVVEGVMSKGKKRGGRGVVSMVSGWQAALFPSLMSLGWFMFAAAERVTEKEH